MVFDFCIVTILFWSVFLEEHETCYLRDDKKDCAWEVITWTWGKLKGTDIG